MACPSKFCVCTIIYKWYVILKFKYTIYRVEYAIKYVCSLSYVYIYRYKKKSFFSDLT